MEVNATTGQATLTIHRPSDWAGGSWRSFVVRIDGKRVGKIAPGGTGEFSVPVGPHTVEVSMDWARSVPLHLTVEPGARLELVI